MYKVLHLDDDIRQTELLKMLLKSEPFELISANTALQALELALTHHPDLIITDINLPVINGTEFAQQLRSHPDLRHIPIVALTANAMYGDREHYLSLGFDDYMAKPLLRIELIKMLQKLLIAHRPTLTEN